MKRNTIRLFLYLIAFSIGAPTVASAVDTELSIVVKRVQSQYKRVLDEVRICAVQDRDDFEHPDTSTRCEESRAELPALEVSAVVLGEWERFLNEGTPARKDILTLNSAVLDIDVYSRHIQPQIDQLILDWFPLSFLAEKKLNLQMVADVLPTDSQLVELRDILRRASQSEQVRAQARLQEEIQRAAAEPEVKLSGFGTLQ